MGFDRGSIKRTLFGNYRPEEVDGILDTAEELLRQKEAETAGATARAGIEREKAEKLAAELKLLQEELLRLQEENEELKTENHRLSGEHRTQETQARGLRSELDILRLKAEELRADLELANSKATILGTRVARQRRELEEKDRLLLEDPIGEANRRAEQIIQNAMDMSKKILDDAEAMRGRALAAVRAARYKTVSFRQELETRFVKLQNDLNQTMLSLRAVETENDYSESDGDQEKWE